MKQLLLLVALGLLSACPSPEPAKAPPPPPVAEETPAPTPAPDAGPMITLGLQGGSTLGFVARKNDEADVAGTFTALSGSVSLPGHDLSKATGTVSIAWFGGVDTSDPARDQNIIGTFFGALDATAPAGQVGLNSLEVETSVLDVGASTTGNAFVDVGAGRSMMGLAAPVRVERTAESSYTVTLTEPVEVSIDSLGMSDRKAALMTLCGHTALGNTVKITGSFVFGQ